MGNCALVLYKPEPDEPVKKQGFLRQLMDKFTIKKSNKVQEIAVDTIFEIDDFRLTLIELPYTRNNFKELSQKKLSRFNRELEELCREQNIGNCYMHRSELHVPDICQKNYFTGEQLFKCLLGDVLEIVCKKRRTNIGDLNITVIAGNDKRELEAILEMLAPSVRYLSLLTERREQVEDTSEVMYEEYGLSIGISEDFSRGFKDADIVINLGKLERLVKKPNFKKNAVLINYGRVDNSIVSGSGRIINGVEVGLPGKTLRDMFGPRKDFNTDEIAEMILLNKLNREEGAPTPNVDFFKAVSREFRLCGMVIKNLRGAYDIIRLGDTF